MSTVALKNVGTTTFVDKWDGAVYRIKPGAVVLVPEHVAKHWLGDWTLTGEDRSKDVERAKTRRGKLPPLIVVEDDEDEEELPPAQESAPSSSEQASATNEEESLLKELRQGGFYVFPDGERVRKKSDALAYLRKTAVG